MPTIRAFAVLGDHERAFAARDAFGDAAPERHGLLARQRQHEAHRRAAFDAVDQHFGERFHALRGFAGADAPDVHVTRHSILHKGCLPPDSVKTASGRD